MKRFLLVTSLVLASGACAPALANELGYAEATSILDTLPQLLGRLHPVLVHFPIALLTVAVLFEAYAILIRHQRDKPSAAGLSCVLIGALGAGAAAWAGWINADLEPHARRLTDLIEVHRWLGLTTVALAGVALLAGLLGATGKARHMTALYRVALILAAGAVTVAGHWGGSIVYGEDYLTEVLFPKPAQPATHAPTTDEPLAAPDAVDTTTTVDFATQIAPIFANHCIKCHGPDKAKADLRFDARRFVFDDRDPNEWVIIPGDAFASDLLYMVSLPRDDEDAMPPEGKADPLTADQITLLELWINEGAAWPDTPANLNTPSPTR